MAASVTRSKGFLEGFLARMRAKMANRLIPPQARQGRICDLGCGNFPYFLTSTKFAKKYGVDQIGSDDSNASIQLFCQDLNKEAQLPFADDFLDVVTMLAVVEHLEPQQLAAIFADVHRVLKPQGMLILTTPPPWSDPILRGLVMVKMVSAVEIDEHKDAYTFSTIAPLLEQGNFAREDMRYGYFEAFLNLWVTATKW